ncbi:MAG: DUF2786 domain-containing protein [Bacteroidota bacterium]
MKDKIKSKINALLTKTQDNGCTEAEAMAAIKMARKLMENYFISESDLLKKEKCVLESVPYVTGYWLFINALAETFDCKTYKSGKEIFYFGYEQDVQMCLYFNDYIIRSCRAAIANYKRTEAYLLEKQFTSSRRLTGGFRNGFLNSIAQRLTEMYQERKNQVRLGHGLINLEKEKQVETEFAKLGLNLVSDSRSFSTGGAYNSGQEQGRNFNINQGVNDQRNTLRLE